MTSKVDRPAQRRHPFYQWVAEELGDALPRWNFHKYLIGKDGALLEAFSSAAPLGPTCWGDRPRARRLVRHRSASASARPPGAGGASAAKHANADSPITTAISRNWSLNVITSASRSSSAA